MATEVLSNQDISRLFFGNKHRVSVWLAVVENSIEPPERFTYEAIELAIPEEIKPDKTRIRHEVKLLEQLGMVELDEAQPDKYRYYHRTPSPLWGIVTATVAAIHEVNL